MNYGKKRLPSSVLAVFLTILMVFQMIPMTAIAADDGTVTEYTSNEVTTTGGETPSVRAGESDAWTVTFMSDGTEVSTVSVPKGESIGSENIPEEEPKDSYRFDGWFVGDLLIEGSYQPEADVTVEAKYTRLFTVTFLNEDGKEYATAEVEEGQPIGANMPEDPSAPSGKTFAGWFDGETEVDAETVPTADITATAKFTEDFVVTFMVDGKEYGEKRFITEGEKVGDLPEKPFKSGYRFKRWVAGGEEVTADTVVTESITAEAEFEEITVFQARISYYYKNGSGENHEFDATIEQFEKDALPITIESPASTKVDEETEPDAAKQIYYPVVSSVEITQEDLDNAIREYQEHGYTGMVTVKKSVEYVEYTVEYKIDYMLKDLTGDGYSLIEEVDGYGVLGSRITPPIKEYSYAEFEDAETQVVNQYGMVLKVFYTRLDFTLTYDTKGGDYVAAVTKPYGTEITLPTDVTRTGYDFAGWYLDEDLTEECGSTLTLEKNTTVYAKWEAADVNYKIVYMAENADDDGFSFVGDATATAKAGSEVTLDATTADGKAPAKLDKTNFTFKDSTTETIKADGSSVVVVRYSRNVYTIRWNGDVYNTEGRRRAQNQGSGSVTAKYGASITSAWVAAFNNKYPDYAWSPTTQNNDKIISIDTMPGKGDSKWTLNGTTFTLYAFDFSTTKTQKLSYWLENYDAETTTTRNGKTYGLYKTVTGKFNYLYDDADFYNIVGYTKDGYTATYTVPGYYDWWGRWHDPSIENYTLGTETPNSDLTVNFYYATQSYPLTFYNYNGSLISSQDVKLNADISSYITDNQPSAPVNGAEWLGWFTDAEHTEPYTGNNKMPAGLVLYADWKMPVRTITFEPQGGEFEGGATEAKTVEYAYGEKAEAVTATREGFVFKGWFNDAEGNDLHDFNQPLTENVTVYAVWAEKPLSYTVHYYETGTTNPVSDDRVVDARTHRIGDEVTEKAIAVMGYKPDASEKLLTLSASEEENVITFYYTEKPDKIEYTVNYLIAKTEIPVAAPDKKSVDGSTISVIVVPKAVDKDYMAAHDATAAQLAEDYYPEQDVVEHIMTSGENTVTIYYNTYQTGKVTVNYLDMDGKVIRPATTGTYKLHDTCEFDTTGVNGYVFKRSVIDGASGTKKSLEVARTTPYVVDLYFQKELTIRGAERTKTYDGKTIKLSGVGDITVEGLESGHSISSIEFTNAGGRKDVGTTVMKPKNAVISGASEHYYKVIRYIAGSVTVEPLKVTVTINGDEVEETYDGKAHTAGYKVASISNPLYKESYIQFNGATSSVSLTDAGRVDLTLNGLFTNKTTAPATNFEPTFNITNGYVKINPAMLKVYSDGGEKVYDGTPLTASGCKVEGLVNGETLPVKAIGSRTDVGSVSNDVEFDWDSATAKMSNYAFEWHNGTLTVTKAKLTIAAKEQTYTYNGEEQGPAGTYTSAFDTYADITGLAAKDSITSLTLTGKQTDAKTYTEEIVPSGVEIKYGHEKDSDIEKLTLDTNYDVVYKKADLTITPAKVTITAEDKAFAYDGSEKTWPEYKVEGLVGDDAINAVITGSITFPSQSPVTNKVESYEFTKGKASNYDVTKVDGKLTMTKAGAEITIKAADDEKTYDGTALTNKDVKVTEGKLFDGDKLVAEADGSATNVSDTKTGNNPVADGYKIMHGDEDVTSNYAITTVAGTLTIKPAKVTVTAKSEEFTYDGKTHSNDKYDVEGLVGKDAIEAVVTGSITFPSESPVTNKVDSYKFTTGEASNYEVETVDGKLTMTKSEAAIKIKAADDEKPYDGTALTNTEVTVTEGKLFDGDELVAEANGSATNVADTKTGNNPVASYKIMHGEEDVTANYKVTTEAGTLTINPAKVTVTAKSEEFTYDGKAHSNDKYDVEGLVGKDAIEAVVTGSITFPSESPVTNKVDSYKFTTGEASNYEVTTVDGKLTMTKAEAAITIKAADDEKTYDGTELTNAEVTVKAGKLFDGDKLVAEANGTATNVADTKEGNNPVASYKIMHGEEDVTANYKVTTEAGTLTINPRKVTVTAKSEEFTYDGKAHSNDKYDVEGLVGKDAIEAVVTGSITFPSESPVTNKVDSYKFTTGEASNYEVETVDGKLTMTKSEAEITIKAADDEKTYDGTALTNKEVKVTEGELFDGDELVAKANGTATNVADTKEGNNPVADGWKIMHGEEDVTENYKVTTEAGTLTINPRKVTLTSATDSKEYDGKALTNDKVTVSGEGFVDGEGATYEVTGTQTVVGSSENTFTYKLNEGTKADNYDISQVYGTLTVTNRDAKYKIEAEANSAEALYDGKAHKVSGLKKTTFEVEGNTYTLEGLTAEAEETDAGEYPVSVVGTPIVRDASGNNVTDQFSVTTKNGKLAIKKRSVTLTSADGTKVYDGTALTKNAQTDVTVSGDGFASGEGAKYDITGSQTEVGSSDNEFTYTLNEGTKADNYTIETAFGKLEVTELTEKVTVTITENSGTEKYDGTEKTVTGYKVSIDNELYTEADFTFNGDATVKGTDAGSYNMELKAEDFKNISKNFSNVEFVIVDGTLEISKRTVTLTSADDEKVYDGTALTNDEVTVGGDKFADGEGAKYDVTGTQTEVGESANAFTYTLNDGTKAANYEITKTEGTLKVTELTDKVTVTITENSGKETYDGKEKTVTGYEVTSISNKLYKEKDFTFSGDATVKGTDAGTYEMELKPEDFTNTSKNFKEVEFVIEDGTLEIEKRKVTLTSATDSKEYDGKALTNDEVTVGGDKFADGEGASYDVTGTQTVVGSSENTFTYKLNDGTKAANYDITQTNGTLTVTNRGAKYEIKAEANSDEVVYDGKAHKVSGLKETTFEVEGNTYTLEGLTAEAEETDAGEYPVNVVGTPVVKDSDGNDVSSEFKVTTVNGTLKINKRKVTLTSADGSKVYDGKPLTKNADTDITVSGNGFAEGDGASYDITGTQTLVGTSENTFTYTLNDGTKADNYEIETVFGTLKVTDGTDPDDPKPVPDDLVVTKKADKDGVDLGEDATFTITATNIYNEARTITLKEIEGVTLEQSTFEAAAGETVTTKATYTITEADILNGSFTNTVTATVGKVTKEASATVKTAEENPKLTLVKETTSEPANKKAYALGETVEYSIIATNEGNVTLHNIVVTDELEGAVLDFAEAFDLKPGEEKEIGATYTITEADIKVGKVINVVTAKDDEDPDPKPGEKEVPTDDPKPHLTIVKEETSTPANGKTYALGETVEYKITVKNDGNVTIHNVEVIDELPGAVLEDTSKFDLAPGAEKSVNATYVITEDDIKAGSVKNVATAKGDEKPDPKPGENVVPTDDPKPHLTIEKEETSTPANGKTYALDETVEYKITVKNDGNVTIHNVEVIDELPGAVLEDTSKFDLAPGEEKSVNATYTITEDDIKAGSVKNVATAKGDEKPDPKPGEKEVPTDDPKLDLDVVKTVKSTPAKPEGYALGETIEYEIEVTNKGNVTYHNIKVDDELTGLHETIDSLAPGASETFETSYTVTAEDVERGDVYNVATAEGDPIDPDDPTKKPEGHGTTDDPTEDVDVTLDVQKVTTNGSAFNAGDEIRYRITVTNKGNVVYHNVKVTDPLTGDAWTIESLAPGNTEKFEAAYTATEADAEQHSVTNEVSAVADPVKDPKNPDAPKTPQGKADVTSAVYLPDPSGENVILTIHYVTEDGTTVAEDFVKEYKSGDKYFKASPKVTGYTPDQAEVSGIIKETMEVTVVYRKNKHTVTVFYVDNTGRTVAKTVNETVAYGDTYSYTSPNVANYTPNIAVVTGTMPDRDVQVTVIYNPVRRPTPTPDKPQKPKDDTIVINDYNTPLGLGNTSLNAGECFE